MNRIVNRILLEVSVMDGNNFQVLGIDLGGIPLWVSSKFYCQCIRSLSFGRSSLLQYTIASVSTLPTPYLLWYLRCSTEPQSNTGCTSVALREDLKGVTPHHAGFDPLHSSCGRHFLAPSVAPSLKKAVEAPRYRLQGIVWRDQSLAAQYSISHTYSGCEAVRGLYRN